MDDPTQRFAICSCRKFYYVPFYLRWDNQQSRKSRHIRVHCITSSKPDGKRVWVYASNVDVVVQLITHCNLLSCRNVYFCVSAEKTNIDSLLEFLGCEHAKCLLTLHCLTGCDTVRKFHNVSKESWTK